MRHILPEVLFMTVEQSNASHGLSAIAESFLGYWRGSIRIRILFDLQQLNSACRVYRVDQVPEIGGAMSQVCSHGMTQSDQIFHDDQTR